MGRSGVLKNLDPDDGVEVPEFAGKYLGDVVHMLDHAETIETTPVSEIVQVCVRVTPCLQVQDRGEQFKQALEVLRVVQFLDLSVCVRMLFIFIFKILERCSTVDEIVGLVFNPGEFEALPLARQQESYEFILRNIRNFSGI